MRSFCFWRQFGDAVFGGLHRPCQGQCQGRVAQMNRDETERGPVTRSGQDGRITARNSITFWLLIVLRLTDPRSTDEKMIWATCPQDAPGVTGQIIRWLRTLIGTNMLGSTRGMILLRTL